MNIETAGRDDSARIARVARVLPYPATPDIAGLVAARLSAGDHRVRPAFSPVWVTAALLAIVIGLMTVPPVRAFVFELIGIGAVRIGIGDLSGSLEFPPEQLLPIERALTGATSLRDARARTGHALPLPVRPGDLGAPDIVYQETLVDGWAVFMLWTAPGEPGRARMSLAVIRSSSTVGKTNPDEIIETTVLGRRAVWTRGPHALMLPIAGADWSPAQILVEANVLIWESDGVTWRLESGLGIEEMRRIAESIAQ
jgi:hypothetical protein